MTTISLPLAVWGDKYSRFIPQWWDGVKSLRRQPDEIVLVTDMDDTPRLLSSVPDWVSVPVKRIRVDVTDFCEYWNAAIEACASGWFAICNVDDYFLSGGLDQVDEADAAGCNFLVDSLQVKQTGHVWSGRWQPETIPFQFTMPGAEPMRKDLFVAAGGYRIGFRFPDWALMVDIIALGLAKPFQASTVRVMFDMGVDHDTMSGQRLASELRDAGNEQVRNLSRELGLLTVQ